MAPIVPIATTHAKDCPPPPRASRIVPVTAMPTTLDAELTLFATENSIAACSGAAISTWFVDQPPLEKATLARASVERRVPVVSDVASPIDRKKPKARAKEKPVMSLAARDVDVPRVLVSQQYATPPRMENAIIAK